MKRAVDVGIGVVIGFIAALILLRWRSGHEPLAERGGTRSTPQPTKSGEAPSHTISQDSRPAPTSQSGKVEEKQAPVLPQEPEIIGALRSIEPPATDEEKARLAVVLSRGSEEERIDALQRFSVAHHRSPDGDPTARQVLEGAIRGDPSERVRAVVVDCFWRVPDAGFDLYLERLLNDPSDQVKRSAIRLTNRMALGQYVSELRLSKMSDKYTQIAQVALSSPSLDVEHQP